MESTLSISTRTSTLAFFTFSKVLNRHLSKRFQSTHHHQCLLLPTPSLTSSPSPSSLTRRTLCVFLHPHLRLRLHCFSTSTPSFGFSGGGSGDFGGNGGGGGGGGPDGGDSKSKLSFGGVEGVSAWSPDVIILDVGGMTCGGCAASVKRILESQPQVSSATVNLTTETAVVWPVSEAKVMPNWQKQIGEALAKHLTSCGFTSNLRDQCLGDRACNYFDK